MSCRFRLRTRCEGFNPLCGDEVVIYLDVDDDTVADIRINGQGCSISQSSASMMAAAIKGKTVDEARALDACFQGDDVDPRSLVRRRRRRPTRARRWRRIPT